jgi:hypothetical protein
MIHPALLILTKLRIRASLRRMLRGLKRPRGVLLFAFWLLLMCVGIIPSIVAVASGLLDQVHLRTAATEIIPLGLMGLSILIVLRSSGESAILFSPSEIDFLFSGPFSRRELLVFKLSTSNLMVFVASLIFSPGFVTVDGLWFAFYIGTVLTLVFLQLLGMSVAFIAQIVAEHIYTRTRKTIAIVVLLLVAIGVAQALPAGMQQGWWQVLRGFRDSSAGLILLAPFEVFSRTILAERLFPDLLLWGGLALTIDLALLAIVLRLDANYLEAAAAVSQKLYGRLEQMKRSGSMIALSTRRPPRWSLPGFPWMGGAGPIAWRQLSVALRNSRSLLVFTVLMFALSSGLMAVVEQKSPQSIAVPLTGIVAVVYVDFILGMFFFPHDIEHIELLKSLPLRSTAVACGELSGVVFLLTLLQALYFCLAAIWVNSFAIILIVAAVFTVPFNLVLFTVENLVFLLYPARLIPNTPGDFQHVGRQMVFTLLKGMLLFVCYGTAAAFGAIAFALSGFSPIAFAAVSWVVLILQVVGLIHLIAWAFRRFDPSVDTPP